MTKPSVMLTEIHVDGFRSLKDVTLALEPINVLIGPNGSGKSSLLTALRLPSLMHAQMLRRFVGEQGGASHLLHYGPDVTREAGVALTFHDGEQRLCYNARLGYAVGDSFVFMNENISYSFANGDGGILDLGGGYQESALGVPIPPAVRVAQSIRTIPKLIARMNTFHFHDTSLTSPLRRNSMQSDSMYLHPNGANLAAYLYRIKNTEHDDTHAAWTWVEELVRRIAPFIRTLEPDLVAPERAEASAVRLFWTDGRGHRFDVHDMSDGTLRCVALFAALTQPPCTRPMIIAIDEPELGLHPAAISLLAGLVRSASAHAQIIVSTQSPAFLDEFTADEVIVTEGHSGESVFKRLDPKELADWIEDYELSQLYNKNVLGGRP